MLDEVWRHRGPNDIGHRAADGLPIHQVFRMPDQEARRVEKRRVRHVVVAAVAKDGRVGVVAAKNRARPC